MQKAYALMTDRRLPVRSLSRYLQNAILKDSKKCRTLDAGAVSNIAPADLRDSVPNEDWYLADIFYAVGAEVIVTTDADLRGAQDGSGGKIRIRMRDEFLTEYLR